MYFILLEPKTLLGIEITPTENQTVRVCMHGVIYGVGLYILLLDQSFRTSKSQIWL